jgi:hypothetical protein
MTAIPDQQAALVQSVATLTRLAKYQLPAELDQRILDLSERKEELSNDERSELLAWVQFTQERSIEKFGAEAALQRLAIAFPEWASAR